MSIQFYSVGSVKNYFDFVDSLGYALGADITLAQGASSGASEILGVQTITIPIPPARAVVQTGDNTTLGAIQIPGNTPSSGTMVISVRNPTLANKSIGLKTETIGNTAVETFGTPCPVFQNAAILSSAPATDKDGNQGYETIIWNRVSVYSIEEATISDSALHQFTYNILAKPSTLRPWGAANTIATNGTTKALGVKFFNTYPALLMSFTGDGATVTVTLDQAPTGTTGNDVMVWQDGTALVQGAGAGKYTVSGSVVTFGTAPTAAAKVVILYFYAPTC